MKQQVIELLAFPRTMVDAQIDRDNCPHPSGYAGEDGRCTKCDVGDECRWLMSNDAFAALEEKTTAELVEPLGFAVDFVNIQLAHWGHDPARCGCVTCAWVRAAMDVRDEAERLSG